MQRRNWLQLSRKLVDRFDLDTTLNDVVVALGQNALDGKRYGIRPNSAYPNPFVTVLSATDMTGTVASGVAFDESGQRIEVTATQNFQLPAADATNPMKALLVLRYAQVGDTSIPQPSNPALNVFLNLDDSFSLVVLAGTPAVSPSYPATQANDVVLMGYSIPANTVHANATTEDATVRDQGLGRTQAKTANYTATAFDNFIACNANGGGFTITAPPSRFAEGWECVIQKTDSSGNAVTIQLQGTDTFRLNGSAPNSVQLTAQAESITLKISGGVCYVE